VDLIHLAQDKDQEQLYIVYVGVVPVPQKMNNTCGKIMHTGTMDRGFTVSCTLALTVQVSFIIESTYLVSHPHLDQ
jgi:hypothetical protein